MAGDAASVRTSHEPTPPTQQTVRLIKKDLENVRQELKAYAKLETESEHALDHEASHRYAAVLLRVLDLLVELDKVKGATVVVIAPELALRQLTHVVDSEHHSERCSGVSVEAAEFTELFVEVCRHHNDKKGQEDLICDGFCVSSRQGFVLTAAARFLVPSGEWYLPFADARLSAGIDVAQYLRAKSSAPAVSGQAAGIVLVRSQNGRIFVFPAKPVLEGVCWHYEEEGTSEKPARDGESVVSSEYGSIGSRSAPCFTEIHGSRPIAFCRDANLHLFTTFGLVSLITAFVAIVMIFVATPSKTNTPPKPNSLPISECWQNVTNMLHAPWNATSNDDHVCLVEMVDNHAKDVGRLASDGSCEPSCWTGDYEKPFSVFVCQASWGKIANNVLPSNVVVIQMPPEADPINDPIVPCLAVVHGMQRVGVSGSHQPFFCSGKDFRIDGPEYLVMQYPSSSSVFGKRRQTASFLA